MADISIAIAEDWETEVEDWMLWENWQYVGCGDCQENGPQAKCWGLKSCHGYYMGCGCKECLETERAVTELVWKGRDG